MAQVFTSASKAIIEFVNHDLDTTNLKVTARELKEFKGACSVEEWNQFGQQAADLLGGELNPLVAVS